MGPDVAGQVAVVLKALAKNPAERPQGAQEFARLLGNYEQAAMQGKSLPEIIIMARKDSGDAHLDYLKITLSNAAVSGPSRIVPLAATRAVSQLR